MYLSQECFFFRLLGRQMRKGFLSFFFFFFWQSAVLHGIMSAFIKSLFSCKPFWKSFVIAELCQYISDPRRRRGVFFSHDVDYFDRVYLKTWSAREIEVLHG